MFCCSRSPIPSPQKPGLQVEFINPIFEFSRAMRELQLDDAEYALLIAINIFSADRPNVQDHGLVEALQQPYIEALSSYIHLNRPQVPGLGRRAAVNAEGQNHKAAKGIDYHHWMDGGKVIKSIHSSWSKAQGKTHDFIRLERP